MYSDLVRDRKREEVQAEEVTKDFPFSVARALFCFGIFYLVDFLVFVCSC